MNIKQTIFQCRKCGGMDFGFWISASTGKRHRYCRLCRRKRANAYSERKEINGGKHSKREWLEKLASYGSCPRCHRLWSSIPRRPDRRYKYVWTKDHIIPLNLGGNNTIDNIQPLCYQCNFSKCDNRNRLNK